MNGNLIMFFLGILLNKRDLTERDLNIRRKKNKISCVGVDPSVIHSSQLRKMYII